MTWIVGATAFNGLVCVADVQVTFEYLDKSRPPRYFNCVKKLHKVFKNLYIGFSGDVRSGLMMIERLQSTMKTGYRENELFDIEGQLETLQNYLADIYLEFNVKQKPELDLMFLWLKQEGESPFFEPACMRFGAPNFGHSGIGPLQINQSGSGKRSEEFQALIDFLSGRSPQEKHLKEIFNNISTIPNLWTASKIRTLLIKEGGGSNYPGVSKTFQSVVAELGWNKVVSPTAHEKLMSAMDGMGLERWRETTRSDTLHMISFDFNKFIEEILRLNSTSPSKLQDFFRVCKEFQEEENLLPLCELPEFIDDFHCDKVENVDVSKLCSTWSDMEKFMHQNRINIGECSAMA